MLIHKYFNYPLPSSTYELKVYALYDGLVPTYNWTTRKWNNLGILVYQFPLSSARFVNTYGSIQGNIEFYLYRNNFPSGHRFRLWVQVDGDYQINQIHHGDDVFPTDVMFSTGSVF